MIKRKKLVGKVEIAPRFYWVGEQPKLPFFVPHIQQESKRRQIGSQTASYYAVNRRKLSHDMTQITLPYALQIYILYGIITHNLQCFPI